MWDTLYKHQEKTIKSDDYNLVEKVKQMEKITLELTQKILCLEKEIVNIQKKNNMSGGGEGQAVCKSVQEKEIQIENDITDTNGFRHRKILC